MTDVLPVTVTNTSPCEAALVIGITWKPYITASRARIGSTSVTMTWAPSPLARGDAATAHPVAGDDERASGQEDVRRAQDPVDRGLARSVAVVEQVLRIRVVDGDHRE